MTSFEARLAKASSGILVLLWMAAQGTGVARASNAADSLVLQTLTDVKVWSDYNSVRRSFVVNITWREAPDSCAAYINPPDTLGWATPFTPAGSVSVPTASGVYRGDIDRTVAFSAFTEGTVGVDSITVTYFIRGVESFYSGALILQPGYVPGTPLDVIFRSQNDGSMLDLGLDIAFSAGLIGRGGGFLVGLEDFEGFHVWRGIEPDGSDLEIIAELSKEEAFIGDNTGGSFVDEIYYDLIIPDLRATGTWFSPFGTVECLGTRIDVALESDEFYWFDCNAVNGFTYYYTVTTFDRGYAPRSGRQGLVKKDNCSHTGGTPYECRDDLVEIRMEVDPQTDMSKIYAVPNPYRTGGSRLTIDNYHNFPDDKIRFVNVPPNTTLKVYTVSGDLVWEYEHTGPAGNIEWDVTNRGGSNVGSGVYVFRALHDSGNSVFGRIVVIR